MSSAVYCCLPTARSVIIYLSCLVVVLALYDLFSSEPYQLIRAVVSRSRDLQATSRSRRPHSHRRLEWLRHPVSVLDPSTMKLDQHSPRLHNYIRARYLYPPSSRPYSLTAAWPRQANIQDTHVGNMVVNKLGRHVANGGIFVEVGAYDGLYSHTIELEMRHNWTGLLIECNPELVSVIRKINRKAYFASLCLSTTPYFLEDTLTSMDNWLAASSFGTGNNTFPSHIPSNFTKYVVQMAPLYSIVAAVGLPHIDFLVLDVQSLEWDVIQHFPFHKILVKVLLIETVLLSDSVKRTLRDHMTRLNYSYEIMKDDDIYIHTSVNDNDMKMG